MELEDCRPVNIIIPIYNAYEELQLCVESIKKYTDLKRNRLILINDKSPDKRIEEYLEKVKEQNICVLHNEENLGFSGTINRGIQLSQNDVLLLNSDTVVTKRWIEKIVNCAYSDNSIATVTPLSNNATLCSVPEFCEENKLPEDMTIDDMAELVENASAKLYPCLPVAHGFCMFIKRSVIEEIGVFDAKTFERGYGEENDFCYRAIQAGYYHVMCDDTYIYHSGTSSFVSEEKQKYIREHEKILMQRYPKEMEETHTHCMVNPNKVIFENIKNHLILRRNKINILLFMQSDFREDASDNCGGTQFHVKDLMMGLRDTYNVFVAARDRNFLNVTAYSKEKEICYRYFIDGKKSYPVFTDKIQKQLVGSILDVFQIQLVHVHHTKGLSLDIFYEAEKRKIPFIITLHDYYYICPNIKLLDDKNQLCIGKEKKVICRNCLKKDLNMNDTIDYLSIWRKRNQEVLEMAELLITPSHSAKEIMKMYFPKLKDKIQVVEHGSDPYVQEKKKEQKTSEICNLKIKNNQKEKFHIAFIGGLSIEKGANLALNLIKHGSKDIEWFIFGEIGLLELRELKQKNLIKTGAYQREDLGNMLQEYQIDLVCILPILPETFCYTLSEAVLCKVPVLVTEIGALKERIRQLKCGWSVKADAKYPEILEKIEYIRRNKEEYQKVKDSIENIRLRNREEMIKDYKEIYSAFIKKENKREISTLEEKKYLLKENIFYIDFSNISSHKGTEKEIYERLEEAERKLEKIENSFTYHLALKLCQINIPFKMKIRKFVYQIYQNKKKSKRTM